jgi:catechol 2,3-dioxygenase-like lactoylglutathione lyase family enzyme
MITNVSLATVFVKDVDASKRFYVDVLGFDEGEDIVLGEGYRWCTVIHPQQPELQVHLAIPGPPFSPEMVESINRTLDEGGMNGLGLAVDDCRKTAEDLKSKGVQFIQEPEERPYGVEALIRDNSGNWMVLVEHKPYTHADFATGG